MNKYDLDKDADDALFVFSIAMIFLLVVVVPALLFMANL